MARYRMDAGGWLWWDRDPEELCNQARDAVPVDLPDALGPAIDCWKSRRGGWVCRLLLYWIDRNDGIPDLIRECVRADEKANFT